ncbi:MAG: glucosyl-3-phosphoglycerate synthase [Acidimicrobiales bacterium]
MSALIEIPAPIATYLHGDFEPARLIGQKGLQTISVCIPARDEEATIGEIVSSVHRDLVEPLGLVDELVVIDDGSRDRTAAVAAEAGAQVLGGPGLGKGEAMALARGRGDIVVFLDGDVRNFSSHFVTGLLGPLLTCEETVLVKGCYARPALDGSRGGGRVTELVAKPLVALLFPELSAIRQPLAGETAVRAHLLDELELDGGYGVEMGLLIDASRRYGTGALAQVDLGARLHRNRPLDELAPEARQVISSVLRRVGDVGLHLVG